MAGDRDVVRMVWGIRRLRASSPHRDCGRARDTVGRIVDTGRGQHARHCLGPLLVNVYSPSWSFTRSDFSMTVCIEKMLIPNVITLSNFPKRTALRNSEVLQENNFGPGLHR